MAAIAIPDSPRFRLARARLPASLAPDAGLAADAEGLARAEILIAGGRIAAIETGWSEAHQGEDAAPRVDCDGGVALPGFVDVHTHLDKGHIWPRTPNPDGTFLGAITNVKIDREARWSAEDVRRRMDFALRCAHAHGTVAIRTHLDSLQPQADISWPLFSEMREEWRGRVELQGAALFPFDLALHDPAHYRSILAQVARHGGILGAVTFVGLPLEGRIGPALDILIADAKAYGLDLDFHVDESASPDARSLEAIADAVLRHDFRGRVLCGHCCSLALMDESDAARVMDKLAAARIAVVSLPMCNLYLQDRAAGRTPRWRGVVPLRELAAAGVDVMIASDNTRDPFYAYGDLDMLEAWREATRILHLDHPFGDSARMISATPAKIMGLGDRGLLRHGAPADLILLRARSMNELLCRPWADRVVLRDGSPIAADLPDYRELDPAAAGAPRAAALA